MRLLCVHQNFPGQFRDLAPALVERGHELKAISCSKRTSHPKIEILRYELPKSEKNGIHPLTAEVDEWIRRSELVARAAESLHKRGWAPDVIMAHPGWGESLMLRDVYRTTPQVLWPELWLRPEHMGSTAEEISLEQKHYLRCKNCLLDSALAEADAVVLPTAYQAATFPSRWKGKIQLIHEGVPDAMFKLPRLKSLSVGQDITLGMDLPVVSFISRNLEPMRGFPQFMRALPKLQTLNQKVQVVIVGGEEVSYSVAPQNGRSWKQVLLEELGGRLDHRRIHWLGRIAHEELIKLYCRSDLHIYLSQAFVLSWSLTEILACGTPILAQNNPMMRELIQPGVNGALFEGSPDDLAEAIALLLRDRDKLQKWGAAGREQLRREFRQKHCLQVLEQLLLEKAHQY